MTDQRPESTPAALYACVSSDRPDVDLTVAAQLRSRASVVAAPSGGLNYRGGGDLHG